ncbi:MULTISPECIES: hypothetical protein [Nocardia]|uniref:hypothetical protein n=1 Tax=Nocardia TaxID=1817 RepID=UPI0012D7142E|nr:MULTISPECIES: hypothetical protein [Nocardia]MBF6278745.1 hypothetical protein [Nocardia nova]
MRSDEAARLLGIPQDTTAAKVRGYLGHPEVEVTDGDDLMSAAAARKEWARGFEKALNTEPVPEHEPSATPVSPEFHAAGPGDLNHNFQN